MCFNNVMLYQILLFTFFIRKTLKNEYYKILTNYFLNQHGRNIRSERVEEKKNW